MYQGFLAWFKRPKKEGNFEWISGEPVIFTDFRKNELNSLVDEDCVHTFTSSLQWNDVWCGHKKQSICEMNYNVDLVENKGNKYYFGTERISFVFAYLQCGQRGGHLVSYANEAEWRFITREAKEK